MADCSPIAAIPRMSRRLTPRRSTPFELLVVNLYPFEETIAKGAAMGMAIENIDIGGPAMIRAAAKNHDSVAVIVDPADYAALLAELDANEGAVGSRHAGARRQGLRPHRRL